MVGFDDFTPLGYKEFGAETALPIWISFMREVLNGVPEKRFETPPGITTARIDPETGQLAASNDTHSILEFFRVEDIARLTSGPNNPSEEESACSRTLTEFSNASLTLRCDSRCDARP